jgi:hypothetical protein
MEIQEMKQRIKDYFVEIKEDKFTKVKEISCKHEIKWQGKDLENKFMLTKDCLTISLALNIDYRYKDDVDSVFFGFTYSNTDGGYPGMKNIKMYLILDDDRTIELSDASGFDNVSQSEKVGDNYFNIYIEKAILRLNMSDFIAIANANKVEYSIRFGGFGGSLESSFRQNDLTLLKGFYNAAFDQDFEFENLSLFIAKDGFIGIKIYQVYINEGKTAAIKKYQEVTGTDLNTAKVYVDKFDDKVKAEKAAKYSDPIEKHFFSEDSFDGYFFNKQDSVSLMKSDNSFAGFWPDKLISTLFLEDLKVGVKDNRQSKAPNILIFPSAIVYNKSGEIFQINFCDVKLVEFKKGIIDTTIIINDDKKNHKIDITNNYSLAIFISDFVKREIEKKHEKKSYIYSIESHIGNEKSIKETLIIKYNISKSDVLRLKEIEIEKSALGIFSLKKEKLKSESMNILKPYNVKFMELGMLLEEIKNS